MSAFRRVGTLAARAGFELQSSASMAKSEDDDDPFADTRMTLGEHLVELRRRLIRSAIAIVVALCVTWSYYPELTKVLRRPMDDALAQVDAEQRAKYEALLAEEQKADPSVRRTKYFLTEDPSDTRLLDRLTVTPRLSVLGPADGFFAAMKVSLYGALAVAGPILLWQMWQFIAAGLYPHERKYITKFLPLSIVLLIAGMLFVYFVILPWTLSFLVGFSTDIQLPSGFLQDEKPPALVATSDNLKVKIFDGNPAEAANGDLWYDSKLKRFKVFLDGQVRNISLSGNNLLATEIKLSHYIDLVIASLLIFGISFQLPLVVLTVARIGVVPVETLKNIRQYVYFTLAILAAVVTPGGDIPSMLGLTLPLILLYELGIWLATMQPKEVKA